MCEHLFGVPFQVGVYIHNIFPDLDVSFFHHSVHVDMFAIFEIGGRKIALAVEYNGKQHDPDPKIGFKTYKAITNDKRDYNDWIALLQRDNQKKMFFKKVNTLYDDIAYYLIVVPYTIKPSLRLDYIRKQFKIQTGIELPAGTSIDWRSFLGNI